MAAVRKVGVEGELVLVDTETSSTSGTGARRQRATYERAGDRRGVVAELVARIAASAEA
jgi:hypothetical protein